MATLGELARKTAACCGVDNNPSLLNALGLRTSELEQSQLDFSRLRKKYNFTIKTFREGSGWKPLGVGKLNAKVRLLATTSVVSMLNMFPQVVPDYSSTMGDAAEHTETLEGNHTEIFRIRHPNDPNYVKLSGQLKIMCADIRWTRPNQIRMANQNTASRQGKQSLHPPNRSYSLRFSLSCLITCISRVLRHARSKK